MLQEDKVQVLNFLKTARQVDGIIRMVEDDRYRISQILSAQALLKRSI